jgi:hypothetical protein
MNYGEVKQNIEDLFYLVQNRVINVDECFNLFNGIRKDMGLEAMSREQFDKQFSKTKPPQPTPEQLEAAKKAAVQAQPGKPDVAPAGTVAPQPAGSPAPDVKVEDAVKKEGE